MSNNIDLENVPEATTVPRKRMRFSVVWIIPIVAALVGLGIAIQQILSQGPTITIVFKSAKGIEAGKTFLKYKDVNIGLVSKVSLSGDFHKVEVTAKIDKSAAGLMVEDARFWVEQPRVTLSGISGIGTLLSGNFIGLDVGRSQKQRREFIGMEEPPSITVDQPGRQFILQANELGSLGMGSPLYYRRLNVGQVIGYDLTGDGMSVKIKVFVNAPYDKYVMETTRFWETSGIDVTLGANGLNVQTQSVLSLLIGGIAFETPPASEMKPMSANAVFRLYNDRNEAMAKQEAIVAPYVLHFNESLRGLNVGAPVTYLGLPVGEVTAVGLDYNQAGCRVSPRVDIVIYAERFLAHINKSAGLSQEIQNEKQRHGLVQRMVDAGVRAQLRSGSILTGQLYVALERFPDAPKVKVDWTKEPPELPVMPGVVEDLENKINSILAKIDKMPLDAIGGDLNKLLVTVNQMMGRIDGEVLPGVKTTMEDMRRAILAAERVLNSTEETLVGSDARAQQELREALQEIARAARGISALSEYLERHPEALIRGKTQEKP